MVEEIRPNFFRIEIPLPDTPLKYLNSYVIKGPDRNLIVDTGLNRKECFTAMEAGLAELEVDLDQTDLFITHLHADHFGLVAKLIRPGRKTYFNRPDSEIVESWGGWEPMLVYGGLNGFPADQLRAALDSHPGRKFSSDWVPQLSVLDDNDVITVGDYSFRCIATPGHSRGHTCLYEASEKILLAGDHILIDITPNIQCWSDKENPLKNYLASLDKVARLEIDLVLPGHRSLIHDCRARVAELKEHHYRRAEEILTILQNNGPMNAYQTASKMTWDIECESWDQFPLAQKWFATGEAISHLRYLEEEGKIRRQKADDIVTFVLTER